MPEMNSSALLQLLNKIDDIRKVVHDAWVKEDSIERDTFIASRPRKYGRPVFTDADLVYSAGARCECGAGMAYVEHHPDGIHGKWECSAILKGEALPATDPASVMHTAPLPFAFYEVKSEKQPSANGNTTRPL